MNSTGYCSREPARLDHAPLPWENDAITGDAVFLFFARSAPAWRDRAALPIIIAAHRRLDVGRAREAGVVAQDAQREAVADDGPERGVAGVERLLRQHEGAAPARFAGGGVGVAKALGGAVQRLVEAGQHQGHVAAVAGVADGVALPGVQGGGAARGVGKVQHVAQQGQQPLAEGERVGVRVRALAQGLEVAPEGERDLEVARDLVAQLQALGDAVVRLGLLAGLGVGQQREAGELFGGDEAAFDADGAVRELMR